MNATRLMVLSAALAAVAGPARADSLWAASPDRTRSLFADDTAHELVTAMPGVSCVKPRAALYLFPRLDPKMYPIVDDQQFVLELLEHEKVLVVQGSGFNWPAPDHLRLVFLPNIDDLGEALGRLHRFLDGYRRRHA